jgi:hypothetical protein
MHLRPSGSLVTALTVFALAAPAYGANFAYRTDCKVIADGTIRVSANLATPSLVDSDFRTESLADSHAAAVSTSSLTFNGLQGGFAEVFRESYGDGACVSDLSASVAGQTGYSFQGTTTSMLANVNSLTSQGVSIQRTGSGGGPVTGSTEYTVPQTLQLNVTIPFKVTANGVLTMSVFDFFRQDSSPETDGSVVGAFQIFQDTNGNCQLDAGEQSSIGSKGTSGPNDTFSNTPMVNRIAQGNYLLILSYFTDVDLAAFSADCSESPSFFGNVADGYHLELDIQ